MTFIIDKNIVRKRFERSILSYNSEARVQKNMVKELVLGIMKTGSTPYRRVLEIGCGTGFLTHEFLQNFRPEEYVLNDLSAPMQKEIEKITFVHQFANWRFLAGDAEQMYFPGEFDLVLSASAFQWFRNIAQFLSSISRRVKKGGVLAFSTFGSENFREIKILQDSGLNYPSVNDLVSWLSPSFRVIECFENIVPLYFTSPYEVLKHIKRTGVNSVEKSHWNRHRLTEFETKYAQNYSSHQGKVTLTYHPIMIIAQKK